MISVHDIEHFSHDLAHDSLSSLSTRELHAVAGGSVPKDHINHFVSETIARKAAHDILKHRGAV